MKTIRQMISGLLALALVLPLSINAIAQDASTIKKDLTVGNFTSIIHDNPCVMKITQGDVNAVSVEGPAESVNSIEAKVNNGDLSFGLGKGGWDNVILNVTVKDLRHVEVQGASVLQSTNEISADVLELEAEGASGVDLQLKVNSLKSEISGASTVTLRGSAITHESEVSGASNLKATDFKTATTTIEVSGAAEAKIDATETLNGEVSGAASLYNKSQPTNQAVEESGAGSVVKDTTKLRFGDKNVMIFDDKFPMHKKGCEDKCGRKKVNPQWAGLELGFNSYVTKDFDFNLPSGYEYFEPTAGRSMSIGLNVAEFGIRLVKDHMTLVTGLGFEFNNYFYKNNYTLVSDTNSLVAFDMPGPKYDKNKLTVSWFRVPLLLQFNTGSGRKGGSFHVALGAIGAVRMCSHTKQTWEIDDTRYRTLTKSSFNLNPFKADATLRIGYGYFNVFVNYTFTPMFEGGKGPKVFPVTAGITLVNI
jgi:hypothetical protein